MTRGRWKRWLARPDFVLLGAFLLFACSAWVFVELAEAVTEGETHRADRFVLAFFADSGRWPHWLVASVTDLTALGGTTVLTLVTVGCAAYLGLARRLPAALWLVSAVIGGVLLSNGLKLLFQRPRPDVFEPLVEVSTASFPSGHAANSAIVFLTLAAILARVHSNRTLRIYVVAVGIVLTVLVGVSRVVLGVHWPSDVLGGWSLGAGWAAVCAIVTRLFELRRTE